MIDDGPHTRRLKLARRHVALARRHVAQSEIRFAAHYERVLKLRAAGEDARDAERLLHSLLKTHQMLSASLALEELMQESDRALVFAALDETRTACLT